MASDGVRSPLRPAAAPLCGQDSCSQSPRSYLVQLVLSRSSPVSLAQSGGAYAHLHKPSVACRFDDWHLHTHTHTPTCPCVQMLCAALQLTFSFPAVALFPPSVLKLQHLQRLFMHLVFLKGLSLVHYRFREESLSVHPNASCRAAPSYRSPESMCRLCPL